MTPPTTENAVLAASLPGAQAAAIGHRRPYITALSALDPTPPPPFAAQHGIADLAPPSWPINPERQGGTHKAQKWTI